MNIFRTNNFWTELFIIINYSIIWPLTIIWTMTNIPTAIFQMGIFQVFNDYIAIEYMKRLYFERVYSNSYISNGYLKWLYFKWSYPNSYISHGNIFHLYICRLIHMILQRANHFVVASSPQNEETLSLGLVVLVRWWWRVWPHPWCTTSSSYEIPDYG